MSKSQLLWKKRKTILYAIYHIIKVQRTKRYSRRLQPEKKRKEKDNSNKIFS